MVACSDVRLAKEGVIGLRPRYLRGLDSGAIRAAASAANVAMGTLLLTRVRPLQYPWKRRWHWVQMIGWDPTRVVPVHPDQTGPGFISTSPALRRSSRRCRAGGQLRSSKRGGCAPPIAQAGCAEPDSRICVRRLHLLAGHHVKVPDRCLATLTVVAKLNSLVKCSSVS